MLEAKVEAVLAALRAHASAKTLAEMGPRYGVPQGVREIHETFQRVSFTPEDFQSDAYITLKRYQRLLAEGRVDSELRLLPASREPRER